MKIVFFIFSVVFFLIGFVGSMFIPLSNNEYNIDEFRSVSGIVQRVEMGTRVVITVGGREFEMLPLTHEFFSRENISGRIVAQTPQVSGTHVQMRYMEIANVLSIKEIIVGGETLLCAHDMIEGLYSSDRRMRNMGIIIMSIGFGLGTSFLVIGIIKNRIQKKKDQKTVTDFVPSSESKDGVKKLER
ncbi:MAG: hypothetical protein FWC11_00235 [Firmicutes bacterium]|nr:hypothetical protein [Bacillota bacterium]